MPVDKRRPPLPNFRALGRLSAGRTGHVLEHESRAVLASIFHSLRETARGDFLVFLSPDRAHSIYSDARRLQLLQGPPEYAAPRQDVTFSIIAIMPILLVATSAIVRIADAVPFRHIPK